MNNICIIGASLSEPHTSESNGAIFIYYYYYGISVVRILYVCLDCNLTQPCAANYFPARAVPIQNEHSFTMGENGEERDAWENSWSVKIYCKRAATCEDRPGYLQNVDGD